jgi:sigma-B regulation protein RsbU (phosphoserine phosphatase)
MDRLALLYRLTQTFNSSLDLEEVLDRVMDEVIAVVRAERGFLMLKDSGGQLCFQVARGLDQRDIDQPKFEVSRGVIERVAETGEAMLASDARSDPRLNLRQSVLILGLRSILAVPLRLKDQVLGVIYVDNRIQAGVFGPPDLELLSAVAANAAVAIENARLYRQARDRGRLEREVQVARELQASLMPSSMPTLAGWEFAAFWQPAREVAGDYYDVVVTDDAPDRLGLVVADVTDKGMPAALFMALARSTVRAALAAAHDPVAAIAHANRLITADSVNSMFVTLAYAQVQADGKSVAYVSAGHNPLLLYHAATGQIQLLPRTGIPLGIDAGSTFGLGTADLAPGDCLLLYTDGATDAVSPAGEEFGLERIKHVVRAHAAHPAGEIIAALRHTLDAFDAGLAQHDDITLLLAKRLAA